MGGGLMQLVAYGAGIFTLQVTHKLLSLKSSTADTNIGWNQLSKHSWERLILVNPLRHYFKKW